MDGDSLPVTQNIMISRSNKKKDEGVEQDEEEKKGGRGEEMGRGLISILMLGGE